MNTTDIYRVTGRKSVYDETEGHGITTGIKICFLKLTCVAI